MKRKQSSTDVTQQSRHSSGFSGGGWLFPTFLAIVLLILFGLVRGTSDSGPSWQAGPVADWTPSPQPVGETVALTIDFGNGAKKVFAALPWQAEMTVADLLETARKFRPGIDFSQIGSGEGGFLSSLDGLANEGASGRNWFYRVDDRHAHVSFCLEKIEPGMHVLWAFTDEMFDGQGK